MEKNIKRSIYIMILGCVFMGVSFISGCGILIEEEDSTRVPVNSTKKLTSGTYYVWHDDKETEIEKDLYGRECEENVFSPVYAGNCTFVGQELNGHYAGDKSRIIWALNDKLDEIPTLHTGDKLIYYDTRYMPDSFTFERFEDAGDTFGVAGLKPLKSGRYAYYFSTSMVYEKSDMARILKLSDTSEYLIFDKVSEVPLTADTITDAGLITGVEGRSTYDFHLYAGTIEYGASIKADTRAFVSMEEVITYDYTLPEAEIALIEIPEYLVTGYYYINGCGLFRYVTGEAYDDGTDFNSPMFLYDEDGKLIDSPDGYEDEAYKSEMNQTKDRMVPAEDIKGTDTLGENEISEKMDVQEGVSKVTFCVEYQKRDIGNVIASSPILVVSSPDGKNYSALGDSGKLETTIDKPQEGAWMLNINNAKFYTFHISYTVFDEKGNIIENEKVM